MKFALLSVSDKTGIVEFASALVTMGWTILSTGGTASALRAAEVPVTEVSYHTGSPEMMDGRLKTLHPVIHGGILGRRDNPGDVAAMEEYGLTAIDVVVVNLYPFEETVAKPDVTFEEAIEKIDIGGPAMIRSAAKNHKSVLVVVDPDDYAEVLAGLERGAEESFRRFLAVKAFYRTFRYDQAIAKWLDTHRPA